MSARRLLPHERRERFWAKVDRRGHGCWLWVGATTKGYGVFRDDNDRNVLAYRYSYEQLRGPIPDGLTLDHLCRVPACVNPDHLEPVTIRENILRGTGPTARNAEKTHCVHGHPFPKTSVEAGRKRRCLPCMRRDNAARYTKVTN